MSERGRETLNDIAHSFWSEITWIISISDISRKLAMVIIAIMNFLFGCCGVWIIGRYGLPCLLLHIWAHRHQRWLRTSSHSFKFVNECDESRCSISVYAL